MQGGEPLSVRSSAKRVKRGTGTILGFSLPRRPLFRAERSAAIFAIFCERRGGTPMSLGILSRQLFPRNKCFWKGVEAHPACRRMSWLSAPLRQRVWNSVMSLIVLHSGHNLEYGPDPENVSDERSRPPTAANTRPAKACAG